MRILGAIVFPAPEIMLLRQAEIVQGSTVRWQFVGDESIRDEALFLEQFAHQLQGGLLVSSRLNQDIQYFSLTVDGAPEVHLPTIDGDKHLVEMPSCIWSRTRFPQSSGIAQPELHRPAPDALIGNVYAAFGEHIFNIAEAEGKPEIQPDGVLDNHRRKSVAGIGDLLHLRKLPHQSRRSHSVAVTMPSGRPY